MNEESRTNRVRLHAGRRLLLEFVALVALSVIWCGVASSQQVSGAVRISAPAVALDETSVVLIDSSGVVAAVTTTGSNGNFTLYAPRAGRYRIRVRRIGFLPDSSAYVTLSAGQPSPRITLSLSPFPFQLARVGVEEARRCVIAPQAGVTVFRLWQEAQSALTATMATSQDAHTAFVLRRFERRLDPRTGQVEESRSWDSRTTTSEPYASIPAESLATHGFVVPDGKMLVYYAPDARTLISAAFARTHCFHPREDVARPDLVGLAFEPTKQRDWDRSVRDVSGTLWLDRTTLALRTLDFEYRGNSEGAMDSDATATGHLQYAQLPSGAWIVNSWLIHMPVVTVVSTVRAPNGLSSETGAITLVRTNARRVESVWDAGGDVEQTLAVTAPRDSSNAISPYGAIHGSVVDTTSSGIRQGIQDVRVTLRSTHLASDSTTLYSVFTDTAGSFGIEHITPGTYSIQMNSARLDTLGISITARQLDVGPATQQSSVTTIPAAAEVVHNMCQNNLPPRGALLHGIIRNSTDDPVPDARIDVSWFAIADSRRSHFAATTHNVATFSDARGAYVICGIPTDQALKIVVTDRAGGSSTSTILTQKARVGMANFSLPGRHVLPSQQPLSRH